MLTPVRRSTDAVQLRECIAKENEFGAAGQLPRSPWEHNRSKQQIIIT